MAHRRQHTIPKFYLKQFLSPGWRYRLGESKPHYHNSPSNVAVQKDYYSRNMSSSTTLDDLNSIIEDNCALAFTRIIENPHAITKDEWSAYLIILSYFCANFYLRSPRIIEETRATTLEAISQANILAEKMIGKVVEAKQAGKDLSNFIMPEPINNSTTITLDELNRYADRLRKHGGHRVMAKDLSFAFENTVKSIQEMSMWIVEAPNECFFITSDKPLTLISRLTYSRVGAGWQNRDAMGLIALSPRYFLIMAYEKPLGIRITTATCEQVEGSNLETITFADKEIYSPSKYSEAHNWMRKHGIWKPQS